MGVADYRAEIYRAVSDVEERVRRILVREAEGGRYDGIEFARLVGLRLKELRDLANPTPVRETEASMDPSPRIRLVSPSRPRGKYPSFEVADEALTKIGWAKKKKAEYVQHVPRTTFDQVTKALADLAAEDPGPIVTERILAKVDALSPQSIPTYQTYTVLNFLRTKNVLRAARRGEHLLPADVEAQAQAAWSNGTTS